MRHRTRSNQLCEVKDMGDTHLSNTIKLQFRIIFSTSLRVWVYIWEWVKRKLGGRKVHETKYQGFIYEDEELGEMWFEEEPFL